MSKRDASVVLGLTWLLCAGCHDNVAAASRAPGAESVPQPSAAENSCGGKGQTDCPLQNRMKATLQTYQRGADYERLARSFGELGQHAPKGYDGWHALAERGAGAAGNKDDAAVRQVCKDCHGQHRARYRRELRAQPVW